MPVAGLYYLHTLLTPGLRALLCRLFPAAVATVVTGGRNICQVLSMAERDGRMAVKSCWEEWGHDRYSEPTKNGADENCDTESEGEEHDEAPRLLKPNRRSKSGGKAAAGKQGSESNQEPEEIPAARALKVMSKGVRRESSTLARDYKTYPGPKTKELDSMIAAHVLALRRLAWGNSQDRA